MPIAGLAEPQVTQVLGESALYLSLCRFEAVPLSGLEALASGCVVARFTGFGGYDYATARNGFLAPEDDVLACGQQLTLATRLVVEAGPRYQNLREAAQRTAAAYSRAKFLARARRMLDGNGAGCRLGLCGGPDGCRPLPRRGE